MHRISNQFMLAAAAVTTVPVGLALRQKRVSNDDEKIAKAKQLIQKTMVVQGIPGLSIGVTVNGKKVWTEGFGYANIESGSKCTGDTVMRIASISKPITSTIAARLVEQGKLDLDKDIRVYLPDFPQKTFNKSPVTITTRQLLSHSGGIRHYFNEKKKSTILEDPANSNARSDEFLSNRPYKSVSDALEMFKNDDLVAEPGKKFSYTTHGLTLASAVLEKAGGKEFKRLVADLFFDLGLRNTQLDTNPKIVINRASYYRRNERHVLENCPEVDCSYKWAGGGILSNVHDLLVFANSILYSTQSNNSDSLISQKTMSMFLANQISADEKVSAALGWFTVDGRNIVSIDGQQSIGGYFYHTGGAVGASSVLLIRASDENHDKSRPSGVCVAILCNLQETSVLSLGHAIAEIFRE